MSFEIDAAAGAVRATSGVHVSLDPCEPCAGTECEVCGGTGWDPVGKGIIVQPVSALAVQRFADGWTEEIRESVRRYAEALGKQPNELTADERRAVPMRVSAEFIEQLAAALETAFLGWDDGFVQDKSNPGKSYRPDDAVGETTAGDMWIRYMCEHQTGVVMDRILTAGSRRAMALEGNSRGPSAGTGDTAEAQPPTEAPASTATDDRSAEGPERPVASVPTSAEPASPA